MKPIDADEVIKNLEAMKDFGYDSIAIDGMIDGLSKASTIEQDFKEHAKWVKIIDHGVYWYICSKCGENIPKNRFGNDFFSKYCPFCGSRMEIGEDE